MRSTKSFRVSNLFRTLTLVSLWLGVSSAAFAIPVNGNYVDDSRCDSSPNQSVPHEIGETAAFPIDERIQVFVSPIVTSLCVADDGFANDFTVQMINLSPYSYVNLFFVADFGITIGNADGTVEDLINAPGIFSDAFRIDGTVTLGANNNLFQESGIVNEIFEPGESWRFIVTNVNFPANIPPFLVFDSAGGFSGGSAGGPLSTASIIGTQLVPEPATGLMVCIGLLGLAMQKPRRA